MNLSQFQRAFRAQLLVSSGRPLLAPRSDHPCHLLTWSSATSLSALGLILGASTCRAHLPNKGTRRVPLSKEPPGPVLPPRGGGSHERMKRGLTALPPDSVTGRPIILLTDEIWQEEIIAETKKKKKIRNLFISHKCDSTSDPHHLNMHYSKPLLPGC